MDQAYDVYLFKNLDDHGSVWFLMPGHAVRYITAAVRRAPPVLVHALTGYGNSIISRNLILRTWSLSAAAMGYRLTSAILSPLVLMELTKSRAAAIGTTKSAVVKLPCSLADAVSAPTGRPWFYSGLLSWSQLPRVSSAFCISEMSESLFLVSRRCS